MWGSQPSIKINVYDGRRFAAIRVASGGCGSRMRLALQALVLSALLALLPCGSLAGAHATGPGADNAPPVDPGPCLAAIAASADARIVADCGSLIDNDKAARADRIKALAARGAALARQGESDRAIADYDALLRLDPARADIFNARGELYWKKGERPRAVADFSAALKLNPNHPAARDNYRRLALELERQGAMMALAGKPSFNCAAARRPVEKAICASPALADLDREIDAANARLLRTASGGSAMRELERRQAQFVATRNASFGKAGYDLERAMRARLDDLQRVPAQ